MLIISFYDHHACACICSFLENPHQVRFQGDVRSPWESTVDWCTAFHVRNIPMHINACMHACMHAWLYGNVCMRMYVFHTWMLVCMHMYLYAYACVHMHAYVCSSYVTRTAAYTHCLLQYACICTCMHDFVTCIHHPSYMVGPKWCTWAP